MKSVVVKSPNSGISYTGILLHEKFVLISSHLIQQNITDLSKSKLNNHKLRFSIIQPENDHFTSRQAYVIGKLFNPRLKEVLSKYFGDINDYNQVVRDLGELFTVYVLSFDEDAKIDELCTLWQSQRQRLEIKCCLNEDLICECLSLPTYTRSKEVKEDRADVQIAEAVCVRSAPFGSRALIDSYAQGVISNHIGGVLLTDCPTVAGCEGGIISLLNGQPVGMVVSSMAGWRGEWTGLTLGIAFSTIFEDRNNNNPIAVNLINETSMLSRLRANEIAEEISNSLVHVVCNNSWGSGICIDHTTGLILTNSHVITNNNEIKINFNGSCSSAELIFQVPDGQHFDLALVKHRQPLSGLKNATFARKPTEVCDRVYAVGHPLFPSTLHVRPSVMGGHIARVRPDVLMSTCTVLPGASGGALCDARSGHVIGVVTCNVMNTSAGAAADDRDKSCAYPRVNLNVPLSSRTVAVLEQFIQTRDARILDELIITDNNNWKISKL